MTTTLRNLIAKGLLTETSQIDIGEAYIGVSFYIDNNLSGKECLYLYVETNRQRKVYSFTLDDTVTIEGLSIIATDARGDKYELYFKKQIDLDPENFI